MDAFIGLLDQPTTAAEYGVSLIDDIDKKAYQAALHDHLKAKYRQLLRLKDAKGERDYAQTQMHSDLEDLLELYHNDPGSFKYLWVTLNWKHKKPSVELIGQLLELTQEVFLNDKYFAAPLFVRCELYTGEPGCQHKHFHMHLLAHLTMVHCQKDVKKHILAPGIAKKLKLEDVAKIQVGSGGKSKYVFAKAEKWGYMEGEKIAGKSHNTEKDQVYFDKLGIEQLYTFPLTGPNGLVGPAPMESGPTGPIPAYPPGIGLFCDELPLTDSQIHELNLLDSISDDNSARDAVSSLSSQHTVPYGPEENL